MEVKRKSLFGWESLSKGKTQKIYYKEDGSGKTPIAVKSE